ncbi:MAG: GNAT family N-acetyltransferase [Clostridiales bacterium]|nr:GNAT family N-acetyltransferase [Clostridiales bacterium]
MIKQISDEKVIFSFGVRDIYSLRILSLLDAYGCTYNFACFYAQIDDDSNITAIMSRLDNDWTLSYSHTCNKYEIAEFIGSLGYSSFLCDCDFILNGKYDEGIVMKSNKKIEFSMPFCKIDRYPKLMDLFNFLDYDTADFESWYVDISHRIRHNSARAYTLLVDGETVSSGIFSAIYHDYAILTSVQTAPSFRKKGYASVLVSQMISDIKGSVYLMREKNNNESFYKNLGFEDIGKWRMYK